MELKQLVQSIYLGDRSCKYLLLDGWNKQVIIQVDVISRIRSQSGNWEFYTDEDLVNGLLVFTEVSSIYFDPPGFMPNDLFNSITVKPYSVAQEGEELYFLFELSIDAVTYDSKHQEVLIQIVARSFHLEDPAHPGVKILA